MPLPCLDSSLPAFRVHGVAEAMSHSCSSLMCIHQPHSWAVSVRPSAQAGEAGVSGTFLDQGQEELVCSCDNDPDLRNFAVQLTVVGAIGESHRSNKPGFRGIRE